jgi:hypothetical protein
MFDFGHKLIGKVATEMDLFDIDSATLWHY